MRLTQVVQGVYMYTNSKIAKAVRLAMMFGASTAVAVSSSAFSAEDEAGAKSVERIEVTGSRIKRTDMETATPVTVFSKVDIAKSGLTTISEFMRFSTGGGAGGRSENSTLSQVAGSSSIDQKGFGSAYTLILLNGNRLPGNAIASSFVDLNQVPLAAVERIEYLEEGASAIYGSDAVAGVVNIITKKEMDGISLSTSYGANIAEQDGQEITAQLVAGVSNEKTSILFAFDYWQRKPVQAVNRELGSTGYHPLGTDHDGRSSYGTPGFTDVYYTPAGGELTELITPFTDCPDSGAISKRAQWGGAVCAYDFGALYQLSPQGDRQSIYTVLNHELDNEVQLSAEFRFSRAYSFTANGAAPGLVDVTSSPYVADYLVQQHGQALADAILADPAHTVGAGRRYLDFGNRQKDNENTTFSGTLGAEGTIFESYDWNANLGHSKLRNTQIGAGGQLLRKDVEAAFADGSLNPFVINTFNTREEKELLARLQSAIHRTGDMELTFANMGITGDLGLELPGGTVGFATGVDWRMERFEDRADTASINGEVIGGAGSNGGGDRNNVGYFVELAVPLLDNLDISLAVRNDDINWTGGSASKVTWQAGGAYRPNDMFLLRASAGTGFKAPQLHELFLGKSFGVNSAIDTKLCNEIGGGVASHTACQNTEIRSRSGGNTELEPETSETYNVGVVVAPFDGVDFSVDYWSLKVENIIGSLTVQEILNNEGTLGHLVNRVGGALSSIDSFVSSNLQNLSEESAKGISASVNYSFDTDMGTFGVHLNSDYQMEHMRQSSKIQPLCDQIGETSEPEWKNNVDFDWSQDDFTANIHVRYVGETTDHPGGRKNGSCDYQRDDRAVDSYTQIDMQGSYFMDNNSSVTVGIRNVLDKNPPLSTEASGNWPWYDQTLYSNMGRYGYVTYKLEF
ncbi:MAG: iron complex outermembrane receptor protein [Alteromonadaceae bacterium]|jgi:iron complex outermembrane receptor protein